MGNMKRRTQHVVFTEVDDAWLRAEAEHRGCSISQVIRDLIRAERERRASK